MKNKYLSKIIANDDEGLQMISACCAGGEVKVEDIKYLQKNKVFLFCVKRSKVETGNESKKINSICKFEFIDAVKSKNLKQKDSKQKLELITINHLKKDESFEITLMFNYNACITLSTEIIEVTLDDQNKIV